MSENREQVIRRVSIYGANSADLDVLCPPNRWAAFTDDELMQISGRTYDARWWLELSEEALAELEARAALRSKGTDIHGSPGDVL